MYLKRCEIKNFRSIKYLEIFFEPKFQILVGLNESGKSNILKALSFLEIEKLPEDDDIRDPRHDERPVESAYTRFVFGLERSETSEIYKNIKDMFLSKSQSKTIIQAIDRELSLSEFCDFRNEGLYNVELQKKTKSFRYWSLTGSAYKIKEGWKKIPESWYEDPEWGFEGNKFLFIDDYPEFKSLDDLDNLESVTVNDLNNLVGSEIINLVERKIFNCINWRYTESNILPDRIDIKEFKDDPDSCKPLRNIFYLSGFDDIETTIDNAELKTNGIKNLLRRLSENATKHLIKVWPEYKNISISLQQNGSVIDAGIEDEFNNFSVQRRSDGFKRFITFLLLISVKAKANYLNNSLIIIDEPDIGLHPSGIQYLRDEFKAISKDNYIFSATHSIFMIDKDRIDRHLIIKKDKEETKVISNDTSDMLDEEVIYRALGYSLFELLKQKNIIFEGWTDKLIFNLWLNSRKGNKTIKKELKKIGFLHAFGAKDVQRVAGNLENFKRDYIILTDADAPSLEYQRKFEGECDWLTYHDLGFSDIETIEDFIDEKYINNKINSVLKIEQLDKGVQIEDKKLFNDKLSHIFSIHKLGKRDKQRVKKRIKSAIFDLLTIKQFELNNLVKAVFEKIK